MNEHDTDIYFTKKEKVVIRNLGLLSLGLLIFIGCLILYFDKVTCKAPGCNQRKYPDCDYCYIHELERIEKAERTKTYSSTKTSKSTSKQSSSSKSYDPKYYYSPGVPRPECYVPGCHKLTDDKCGSYCREHYYQYILKRKPSSGSSSTSRSSSSKSSSKKSSNTDSYDKGYESVYEDDDYDEDRYYSDPDYASGVDDAMDELDW